MDARSTLPSRRGPPYQTPHYEHRIENFIYPEPQQLSSRTPSPPAVLASISGPFQVPVDHRTTSLQEMEALREEAALEGISLTPPPTAAGPIIGADVDTGYSASIPTLDGEFPTSQQYNYRASIANATNLLKDRYNKFAPLVASKVNTQGFSNTAPAVSESDRSPSPTKTWASYASSAGTKAKHASRASLLGDLLNLNASSAPLSLGVLPSNRSYVSSEADSDLAYGSEMDSSFTRSPLQAPRQRRDMGRRQDSTTSIGRLSSWFGRSNTVTKRDTMQSRDSMIDEEDDVSCDPLLNMDINIALFPHGPADPMNPSHFHDLLDNAEALIDTLKSAYRNKVIALEDLRREYSLQAEEVDEAETRARHLKVQLDDMGAKVAQQNDTISELLGQLQTERLSRVEEKDLERQKSMVKRRGAVMKRTPTLKTIITTRSVQNDSGFESGGESDATDAAPASVFSEDEMSPVKRCFPADANWMPVAQPAFRQQSTYSSGMIKPLSLPLQMENQVLRARVAELEEAVDSCLDLVGGGGARRVMV